MPDAKFSGLATPSADGDRRTLKLGKLERLPPPRRLPLGTNTDHEIADHEIADVTSDPAREARR